MKINMVKHEGGVLLPAELEDIEAMKRFPTGNVFEIDIKLPRNPAFHGKVFAFLHFCYKHWSAEQAYPNEVNPIAQFERFRGDMLVQAGDFDVIHRIDGIQIKAPKSMAYGNMEQEEFEACYEALIQVAMKHLFKGSDEQIYNQLVGFFS